MHIFSSDISLLADVPPVWSGLGAGGDVDNGTNPRVMTYLLTSQCSHRQPSIVSGIFPDPELLCVHANTLENHNNINKNNRVIHNQLNSPARKQIRSDMNIEQSQHVCTCKQHKYITTLLFGFGKNY